MNNEEKKTDKQTKEEQGKIKKEVEKEKPKFTSSVDKIPDLKSGMTVKVHEKIKDIDAKGKERTSTQVFEGIVLAVKKAKTQSGVILVRKIASGGIGVEKIFPIHSPLIDKIEVLKQIKTRRAKLYFLRDYKKRSKQNKTTK